MKKLIILLALTSIVGVFLSGCDRKPPVEDPTVGGHDPAPEAPDEDSKDEDAKE